jgi:hypothetical protein
MSAARIIGLAMALLTCRALAQLQVLPGDGPQVFFSGTGRSVEVMFRNPGDAPLETFLSTRLFQLSSSTAMPVGQSAPWKRLVILGGQTVLEMVPRNFPSVRAATKFEIRWLDETAKSLGHTSVMVYPTNLLSELTEIAGVKPPGVFDPRQQLTPLLRALRIEFIDLNEGQRMETFDGRLAILNSFNADNSGPHTLKKRASMLSARGVNVVLSAPVAEKADDVLRPAWLARPTIINTGRARIVIVPAESVAGIATNVLAQQTLLHGARLAVTSDLLTLMEP